MIDRDIVRYSGRFDGVGADDTTPAAVLATLADEALVLAIDDPLSFPWESALDGLTTPVMVDITACAENDRAALVPVLRSLTSADVIVDSAPGAPPLRNVSAELLDVAPEPHAWGNRRAAKACLLSERRIIARLEHEYGPVSVIDASESDDPIATVAHGATSIQPTHAIAVRLSAHALAPLGGTDAAARRLLDVCDRSLVAGVWGVRPNPGHRLERAMIVLDGQRA